MARSVLALSRSVAAEAPFDIGGVGSDPRSISEHLGGARSRPSSRAVRRARDPSRSTRTSPGGPLRRMRVPFGDGHQEGEDQAQEARRTVHRRRARRLAQPEPRHEAAADEGPEEGLSIATHGVGAPSPLRAAALIALRLGRVTCANDVFEEVPAIERERRALGNPPACHRGVEERAYHAGLVEVQVAVLDRKQTHHPCV